MRARLFLGASLAFSCAIAACDLNPQPLPPGDQSDGGIDETPTGNGGATNAAGGGTDGSAQPGVPGDGGSHFGSSDASAEAGASSDGSSDAEPNDAGDASD
jgi:hypothetical protein